MSFKGKIVLITGGSSGIGADAAIHLAKLGAKVAIVGRNAKRLNEVAEVIEESGAVAPLVILSDVTKDAKSIVDETIEHFGQLDILVNNAGIAVQDNTITLQLIDFYRVFETNVSAVIKMTQLCVPHLEKTKGNIVNVSSICALKAVPDLTSFSISKAALDQFTKCSALDLAAKSIRVNSINPAMIRTPILETMEFTADEARQIYEEKGKIYPLGRIGEVHDTSSAIAFLANNDVSSFLTGVLLSVDGGISSGIVE